MGHRRPQLELFEPGHNVSLWLHRLNTIRTVQNWSDLEAVREASILLSDVPLAWFLTHCNQLTSWEDFERGMRQRFGDSEQTIIARIQHRKQREDESVQAYAEDMNMMFAQCQFPEVLKRNLLIDNLKPNLRKQVVSSIPTTIEQVITNAIFLEETAVGVMSEKIKGWEQQRSHSKTDAIDRITKSMDKMTIALSNNFSRQNDQHPVPLNRPPAPPRPQRDPGNGPMQCWKCQGYGHKAIDCNNAPRATNYARANLLESHVHDQYNRGSDHDDYTPSTIEAQIYAAGGRTGPMQRAPKHRTSWTPEGIQAARDARANRGNAAASGSGAAPAPVGAPRRAEPGPTPPVVDPPVPTRRTQGSAVCHTVFGTPPAHDD